MGKFWESLDYIYTQSIYIYIYIFIFVLFDYELNNAA